MSIINSIQRDNPITGEPKKPDLQIQVDEQKGMVTSDPSSYNPTEEERLMRQMVIFHFALGYTNMYRPRVEFNDLSTIGRDQTDFLAWNTYQPNNGDPYAGDLIGGWQSNAVRPIERNKAISIAAHATARVLFPRVFAFDSASDYQEDAAKVIEDLMEWCAEKYDYAYTALQAVIQALVSPAAIIHTEYAEVYREVKREKQADGKWRKEKILDETMSGFRDTVVRTDQFFIENFYEPDIQKQGWLIWRRVQDHRLMKEKYGHLENFKYVKPGMQALFNDANQGFYYVYDPNMRQYQDEEVLYWNKSMDCFLVLVNGILVTPADNPNPRWDKQYPFAKFGYEIIDSTCFYFKSLVFKISHDAAIINTLYPMIIDGTYLNVMPPFLNTGDEIITSNVIVPGQVTTLSSPNAQLTPIKMGTDLKSGFEAMNKVEESINQTSEQPIAQQGGGTTAYEISKIEQEKQVQLGLFVQMIGSFIKQFGRLRLNDILQHLTVAQADSITDNPQLVYKTFILNNKDKSSKAKHKKIKLDDGLSDEPMSNDDKMDQSYKTLEKQGGDQSETELLRVNPRLIRELQYMIVVSPDVLNPRSEDVERAYMLEAYDRAIQNPTLDQDMVTRDFLLMAYPRSAKDPDKYLKSKQGGGPMAQLVGSAVGGQPMPQMGGQPPQGAPAQGQPPQQPAGGLKPMLSGIAPPPPTG
jgi:hypothetical protein